MITRRTFVKESSIAAGVAAVSGIVGCSDEKNHKEMPLELMEMQLKFALDGWKDGTLEGFVFLCSSICNREFPAVTAARNWLSEHGRLRRGQ